MFTGLGRVTEVVQHDASSGSFAIKIGDTAPILGDCHIGDSIAVNGASLEQGGWFNVDVAPETLFRTNLGHVKPGDGVNCERAMAPHTRFGGHIVQGHIDTVATLESIVPNESARTLTLRLVYEKPEEGKPTLPLPSTLSPYVIPKGFITLDGASLTLIDVSPPNGGTLDGQTSDIPTKETIEFTVMLIPHTQEHITLPSKPNGARVNVEFDMVGKYVYRSILGDLEGRGGASTMLTRAVEITQRNHSH